MTDNRNMLPDWEFVGGETQKRTFTIMRENGQEYDIQSGTAQLVITDYVNRGDPVLTKQTGLSVSADGNYCDISIALSAADTLHMAGRYIYQLTIHDGNGNTSIPRHGNMWIYRNATTFGE